MASVTAEERRRQKTAYRRQQDVLPAKNTAFSLLQRFCSFQVQYRHLKPIIIGLGIIGGIWTLISWLEIKFLGFYFWW